MELWSNPLELAALLCFTAAVLLGSIFFLLQQWLQRAEGSTLASCLRLVLQGMASLRLATPVQAAFPGTIRLWSFFGGLTK